MDTKKCVTCHEIKQVEIFSKNTASKDGLQDRCKTCVKAYYKANGTSHKLRVRQNTRDRVAKIRLIINELKSVPCVDCGMCYPYYVMDFDHVSGEKLNNVSYLVGSGISLTKIYEEIAKCEVVCSNCHRIRTWSRGQHITHTLVAEMV